MKARVGAFNQEKALPSRGLLSMNVKLQTSEGSFAALLPSVASIESIAMPRPRLMDRLRLRRSLSSDFARFLPSEEQSCDVISDVPIS